MSKNISVFVLAVLFLLLAVTVAVSAEAETAGDKEDLLKAIDAFYAAIDANDAEARIQLLCDDVILMSNHWTMARGKDAVSEILRAGASAVFRIKDREIVHIEISGDLAYTVNSYYYTYHAKGEKDQWHKTKNVHIWRRVAPDRWQLIVDIWNSDVPLGQFAQE